MKYDMHVYANGTDPFVFELDKYIVHVHAGAPPHDPPTDTDPSPESELPPPLPQQTPMMTVFFDPTKYTRPTPVRLPFGLVQVHGVDEMQTWFNEVVPGTDDSPVRFRLDTVSGPSSPEIQTLLEGIQGFGGREVSVDIVGWSESGDG